MASQRKAETFTRWDVTEQLRAKENVCFYLEAAVEKDAGAGRLFRAALHDFARAHTMSQLARESGKTCAGL